MITMNDSTITEVYQTYDYEKFKLLEENRTPSHYKQIQQNVKIYGQLMVPIIVNENFEIIDGQNRFFAWKEDNLPIYYIINPHYGLNEMIGLNLAQKNWSYKDFIEHYATLGLEDYQFLLKAIEETKLPLGSLAVIFAGDGTATPQNSIYRTIKNGEYKVDTSKIDHNFNTCILVNELLEKLNSRNVSLIPPLYRMVTLEGYEHRYMLNKLDEQSNVDKIIKGGVQDKLGFLERLDDVYNYKKQKHNILEIYPRVKVW